MSEEFQERFWATVCSFRHALHVAFVLLAILLLLTIFSLLSVDRESGAFLVSLLNLAVITPGLAALSFALWKCSSR